ncbi:MAG: integration host factor subunit beta [Myxococcota bacterium]
MTKSGLIESIAVQTPHISKKDTEIVVNTIFDSMAKALKLGERIEIRGFGSFQVKIREAREGRNPKTGEPVHISAKRTPFFKVGKELKELVDGSPAQKDSDSVSEATSSTESGGLVA